jgi:AraC-like DNA-binding protein
MTLMLLPSLSGRQIFCELFLDHFRLLFCAHVTQRYAPSLSASKTYRGGLAPWQKRRVSELLRENLDGQIGLADLAHECGLSVSHFARSFKTSFGTSTHQWLMQHRIDHAKRLMSQTGMSLIDIAIQSGFNDQAAFTRAFHQLVGVSPGRWRRHSTVAPLGAINS